MRRAKILESALYSDFRSKCTRALTFENLCQVREELSEGELVRALSGDDPLPNAWQVCVEGVVERDRVAGVSGGRGSGRERKGRD